jgi:ribose-phosphate pyrophosphokinase
MKIDTVIGEDEFSEQLAKQINAKFIKAETYTFPDGEIKLTLKEADLKNKNVLLVLRTKRFKSGINDVIMKIYFATNLLREYKVNEINLLLPYMFYSRQDKQFLPGETKSFSSIARLYESLGISNIITINSHLYGKSPNLQSFFKNIKIHDLSPAKIFSEYLKTKNLKNTIVIGPGKGADKLIEELADLLNVDFEGLEKKKDHKTLEVTTKPPKTDLKNRDVIIYDDVAASGGTIIDTFRLVYNSKPNKIFITLPHLITKEGIEKLYRLGADEIITTDSFYSEEPKKFTELNLVPLISEYIRKLPSQ